MTVNNDETVCQRDQIIFEGIFQHLRDKYLITFLNFFSLDKSLETQGGDDREFSLQFAFQQTNLILVLEVGGGGIT